MTCARRQSSMPSPAVVYSGWTKLVCPRHDAVSARAQRPKSRDDEQGIPRDQRTATLRCDAVRSMRYVGGAAEEGGGNEGNSLHCGARQRHHHPVLA